MSVNIGKAPLLIKKYCSEKILLPELPDANVPFPETHGNRVWVFLQW